MIKTETLYTNFNNVNKELENISNIRYIIANLIIENTENSVLDRDTINKIKDNFMNFYSKLFFSIGTEENSNSEDFLFKVIKENNTNNDYGIFSLEDENFEEVICDDIVYFDETGTLEIDCGDNGQIEYLQKIEFRNPINFIFTNNLNENEIDEDSQNGELISTSNFLSNIFLNISYSYEAEEDEENDDNIDISDVEITEEEPI